MGLLPWDSYRNKKGTPLWESLVLLLYPVIRSLLLVLRFVDVHRHISEEFLHSLKHP